MRINLISIFLLAIAGFIAGCAMNKAPKKDMTTKQIMEVTTFSLNSEVDPSTFAEKDRKVEHDFTSKQPGFIKRQSGRDEEGNYVVVVFWESIPDAEASMSKFMGDTSVADYAQLIEASSMNMARYTLDKVFDAQKSRFVEIMSFEVTPGTDMVKFDALNQRVETDFTAKREGFMQRLTGTDESGKQLVAVYWADKNTSDASLQTFMEAAISREFMQQMDQSSISMGRYEFL